MKKREGDAFMDPEAFGRGIPPGLGLNLLVADIDAEVAFIRDVLGGRVRSADPDFAVIDILGSMLMLHADHTYADHEFRSVFDGVEARGRGAEFRLYGADPDALEAAARDAGAIVLSGSIDKPHGLRECFIISPAGYVYVPSARI